MPKQDNSKLDFDVLKGYMTTKEHPAIAKAFTEAGTPCLSTGGLQTAQCESLARCAEWNVGLDWQSLCFSSWSCGMGHRAHFKCSSHNHVPRVELGQGTEVACVLLRAPQPNHGFVSDHPNTRP